MIGIVLDADSLGVFDFDRATVSDLNRFSVMSVLAMSVYKTGIFKQDDQQINSCVSQNMHMSEGSLDRRHLMSSACPRRLPCCTR